MSIEIDRWEPLAECPPSDRFVCNYEGNFAQALELNRPLVERFLAIAALDGRVLLQESRVRRPQAMPDGVNPDGSVAGRSSLRWGQRIEVEDKKQNPYFQVEPDNVGWVVSINGNLITEDLMQRQGLVARDVPDQFARKFNYYLRVGLREALLKDKCTTIKDPYKYGRMMGSTLEVFIYKLAFSDPNPSTIATGGFIAFLGHGVSYILKKLEDSLGQSSEIKPTLRGDNSSPRFARPYMHPYRLTHESDWDFLGFPFELDRLALAYGYMDYKQYLGNPLVRVSSD